MDNVTIGFIVLGTFATTLTLLAIILHNGKKSLEQKKINKHSLAQS